MSMINKKRKFVEEIDGFDAKKRNFIEQLGGVDPKALRDLYSLPNAFKGIIRNPTAFTDPNEALEYVCKLYAENVSKLRHIAVSEEDFSHNITYPYVGIYVKKGKDSLLDGAYGTTISHPDILAQDSDLDWLLELSNVANLHR